MIYEFNPTNIKCPHKTYNDTVDQLKGIAQLGINFVLGTKYHGFKSYHPYLLLLLWAVTKNQLRSIKIGYT